MLYSKTFYFRFSFLFWSLSEHATLTPIGNSSVGELIPVVGNEDAGSGNFILLISSLMI